MPSAEPTTVLLVRHGTTPTTGRLLPGRAPGLHLSATGRAQAERVAAAIAELDPQPAAVYASPLERARETAAPIARALGVRVRTERGLLELDIGDWTGMSLKRAARRREWGSVQRWPAGFSFPGGESFTALVARATDAVGRLVSAHPGETIVAVSHADPIRALVATAAGAPLDLFQRLVVSTCSVSAVRYTPEGPRVLCVNASAEGLVRA
ncbi:MAG: histidine phosphatase family protein [Actinomycetota bacterium]|nr:histidine phosphatase family protein [Actinomycetota bacterium]